MPEEIQASVVSRTPRQSAPSYIPLVSKKKPLISSTPKTSVKNVTNSESRNESSKRLQNISAENIVKNSVKKNNWSRIRIIRLHEEIKAFHEAMLPQPEDQLAREQVVQRVTDAVKSLWSGAKVEVFGSFLTGLYLPTSDVDLVVFGCWNSKPLHTLKDELVYRGVCEEESTIVIDKATVPIIKLTDRATNIKVDISFNITNGLTTAIMIKEFVKEFPSLPYLVLILKQFVFQRDLNEVFTGGIGSYSLILLIVSYLQLHTRGEGRLDNINLGVQLIEFFELYGLHFNYSQVGISVVDGGKYVRKDRDSQGQVALHVQDPICSDNDVARGSYNIALVQVAFSHAYYALSNEVLKQPGDLSSHDKSILPCIIDFECDPAMFDESADDVLCKTPKNYLSFDCTGDQSFDGQQQRSRIKKESFPKSGHRKRSLEILVDSEKKKQRKNSSKNTPKRACVIEDNR